MVGFCKGGREGERNVPRRMKDMATVVPTMASAGIRLEEEDMAVTEIAVSAFRGEL